MKTKIQYIGSLLLATLLMGGCQKESLPEGEGEKFQTLKCSLSLEVEPMEGSEVATKSTTAELSPIKNLWVIQIDERERVTGHPTYISDVTADGALAGLDLVATTEPQPVIFLANTFNAGLKINNSTTLDQIKAFSHDTTTYIDSDKKEYLMMSEIQNIQIEAGAVNLTCSLKYNVAKAKITLTNLASNLTLTSLQLCNVPSSVNYLMDYELEDPFPAIRNHTNLSEVDMSGLTSYTTTLYIPANIQGSCESENSREENKPLYATPNSTYLLVKGTTDNGETLEYRFYLGGNMIDDFNLSPNHYYDYDLKINQVGSIDNDARITLVNNSKIDYTTQKPANCYIINPSDQPQEIYIPVIERINEFWGNKGYENAPEKMIGTDDNWGVEWIFRDESITIGEGGIELTANALAPSQRKALYVAVPANFEGRGNFTVMITNNDEKLWSWHFWVTDYNPYSEPKRQDDFHYSVEGGEVHRYNGEVWESGVYADKFIMDRPLGASSVDATQKILYYQYGRKDPMPGFYNRSSSYVYNTGYSQSSSLTQNYGTTITTAIEDADCFLRGDANSRYAWLSVSNSYTDLGKTLWGDPTLMGSTDPNVPEGKSIFDPSPLGWKVPGIFTWSGFSYVYQSWNGSCFTFTGGGKEITYYPTGYISYGTRNSSSNENDNSCRFWLSTPAGSKNSSSTLNTGCFRAYNGNLATCTESNKASGYAILCVQE